MNLLTMTIAAALLLTIAVLASGIWSMAYGGEYDKEHSTQFMVARVAMQALTLVLLVLAVYLAT